MIIQLNEKAYSCAEGVTLKALKKSVAPTADVQIYNGFQTEEDHALRDGDRVVFITKGSQPEKEAFEAMMMARHTPGVHETLKKSTVGIAGVGGLGSNAALALARSGVGKLIIADFDVVEPSNLNRQAYFVEHLGLPKVKALKELIRRVNPYVDVETHRIRLDSTNITTVFATADVLIEAFDQPASKAELVNTVLISLPEVHIVAGSGMAGFYSSNSIQTKRKMSKLFIVGDETNEAMPGSGLMAPRVNVAAGHQANMVLRILLGELSP